MAPTNKTPWKSGKKALKAKGVGIDFKRVKSKVGRKLPPPTNATRTDFKSKAIVIPGQSVAADKDGVAVNQRRQTLKELLTQSMHYSEKVRKEALLGMKDLFARHPQELPMHAMAIVEKLSPRITDTDRTVRQTFVLLLKTTILPGLPQGMMTPLVPGLMAHVSSAMTHLVMDVRASACSFLDLLVQHYPALVVSSFAEQIVQHYMDLLGKGGVSGQAVGSLGTVLSSLVKFLTSLNSSLSSAQPSRGAINASQMHCWGQKYTSTKQDGANELQALHGYKSVGREEPLTSQGNHIEHVINSNHSMESQAKDAAQQTRLESKKVQNTDIVGHIVVIAAPLVPVLIECWADCSPTVCSGPMPDAANLSCMIFITQALSLLFQCFALEGSTASSSWRLDKRSLSLSSEWGEEDWDMRFWMRQQFLPGLEKHVLIVFPVAAPSIRLPAKVEEDLVALNVGICELMLHLIVPPNTESDNKTLWYYRDALYGKVLTVTLNLLSADYTSINLKMLPSSEMAEGVVDKKLAEPHVRLLISLLPGVLPSITEDWVVWLLQAFTEVFEGSKAHSATKLTCLSAMAEFLLPQGSGGKVAIPLHYEKQWMQSLPRLLWELKHTHASISQAVLQMLVHIGRSAPEGSTLAEEYATLQPHMIPFFCTFLALTRSDGQWKCLFGPFIKLPRGCQELAVDMLCYCNNFSAAFLKAVAHCCLSEEVSVKVVTRAVEVLQSVFLRGSSGLAEHLSFLVTLLAGRTTADNNIRSTNDKQVVIEDSSFKTRIKGLTASEDLGESLRSRRRVISGVVCFSLSELGDCNLVLTLLGPWIQQELARASVLETIHGILSAVAVLTTDRRSDTSSLPEVLRESLPQHVAEFLVSLSLRRQQTEGIDHLHMIMHRPCYVLLSRIPMFTTAVLNSLQMFLCEVSQASSGEPLKDMCATARACLLIFKEEKLSRVLSKAEDSSKAIIHTLQAHVSNNQNTEELSALCSQLEITAGALYGWQIANVPGGEGSALPS